MLNVTDIEDVHLCELFLDLEDLRTHKGVSIIAENFQKSGYVFGNDIAQLLLNDTVPVNQRAALVIMSMYFADQQIHAGVIETILDDCIYEFSKMGLTNESEFLVKMFKEIESYHNSALNRDKMILASFVRKMENESE